MSRTRKAGKSGIDNQAFSEADFDQDSIPGAERPALVCKHPQQRVERARDGSEWQYCCKKGCNYKVFVR